MRDILVTLVVFGSIPFILARPSVGILMWSWLGYMNPHRLTFGFAYNYPFAEIVGIVTLVSLLFSREPIRIPWSAATVVWLLFVVWMSVTTLAAIDIDISYLDWERVMKIQLMALVTLVLMNTRERINQLVWVIVVSLGFYGVKGGLFTLKTGGTSTFWGPSGGFISGNNEIAFALIMTLPLMRYLQMSARKVWVRYGFAAAMVLTAVAIVGTYSRGAFVAGAAMGLSLVWKSRKRRLLGIAVVLVAILAVSFMPERWTDRMESIEDYQEDTSAMGRINAWWFAFNLALDRPVVGGGFQTFTEELFQKYAPDPDDWHDAHSIYFEVLGEQGFVGLTLYLLLGLLTLRTGGRIVSESRGFSELRWAHDLGAMLQVSVLGYAVGGAFLGLAYFDYYYSLVGLTILTHAVVKRHLKEGVEAVGEGRDRTGRLIPGARDRWRRAGTHPRQYQQALRTIGGRGKGRSVDRGPDRPT